MQRQFQKQYILAHLVVLECLMEHENVFKKSFRENLHLPVFKEQLNYVARLAWHDDVVEHWASRRSNSSSYTFLNYAGTLRPKSVHFPFILSKI